MDRDDGITELNRKAPQCDIQIVSVPRLIIFCDNKIRRKNVFMRSEATSSREILVEIKFHSRRWITNV